MKKEINIDEVELGKILNRIRDNYVSKNVGIELKYWDINGGSAADLETNCYQKKIFSINCYKPIKNHEIEVVLRHELTHIRDILNSDFNFNRDYLHSGTDKGRIFEIRLVQLVWDISIVIELEIGGFNDSENIDKRIRNFNQDNRANFDITEDIELLRQLRVKNSLNFDIIREIAKKYCSKG